VIRPPGQPPEEFPWKGPLEVEMAVGQKGRFVSSHGYFDLRL